jgi:FkbM family methyltransferase
MRKTLRLLTIPATLALALVSFVWFMPRLWRVMRILRPWLPKGLDRHVRAVTQHAMAIRLASDLTSFNQLRRLGSDATGLSPDTRVSVRLRPLNGERILVRRETGDRLALRGTFLHVNHLPPPGVSIDGGVIWDLGSHIGLTAAHLASLFPDARVVAVEMDAANAELCRDNLASFHPRVTVLTAAVWSTDGDRIQYRRIVDDTLSARIIPASDAIPADASAETISLNSLLERFPESRIAYVKMDIEGAEEFVLRENTEWADEVDSIKVEIHEPYTTPRCVEDLTRLGFDVRIDRTHHAAVMGVRPRERARSLVRRSDRAAVVG